MERDARYVDVTPELNAMGATWEDVVAFVNLKSMHPLKPTLKAYIGHSGKEIDDLLGGMPGDIVVYKMRTDASSPQLLVHAGALEVVYEMFRLIFCYWEPRVVEIKNKIAYGSMKLLPTTCGLTLDELQDFCGAAAAICKSVSKRQQDLSEAAEIERKSYYFQYLEKVRVVYGVLTIEADFWDQAEAVGGLK